MNHSTAVAALALIAFGCLAAPAAAQQSFVPGTVLVATKGPLPDTGRDSWVYGYTPNSGSSAWNLVCPSEEFFKCSPVTSAERLFVRSGSEWIFLTGTELGVWDGTYPAVSDQKPAYRRLTLFERAVSNIVLLPTGNYVIAEQGSPQTPRIFEFDTSHLGREIPLPDPSHPLDRFEGIKHMTLRADGCTLLFVSDDPTSLLVVHQMNVCTGAAMSDYAAFPAGFVPLSMRELPGGHLVAATDAGVVEIDSTGRLISIRDAPHARRVALSPDGRTLWVAGIGELLYLWRFPVADPTAPPVKVQLNREPLPQDEITDLAVISEWQPWGRPQRVRAVRR